MRTGCFSFVVSDWTFQSTLFLNSFSPALILLQCHDGFKVFLDSKGLESGQYLDLIKMEEGVFELVKSFQLFFASRARLKWCKCLNSSPPAFFFESARIPSSPKDFYSVVPTPEEINKFFVCFVKSRKGEFVDTHRINQERLQDKFNQCDSSSEIKEFS